MCDLSRSSGPGIYHHKVSTWHIRIIMCIHSPHHTHTCVHLDSDEVHIRSIEPAITIATQYEILIHFLPVGACRSMGTRVCMCLNTQISLGLCLSPHILTLSHGLLAAQVGADNCASFPPIPLRKQITALPAEAPPSQSFSSFFGAILFAFLEVSSFLPLNHPCPPQGTIKIISYSQDTAEITLPPAVNVPSGKTLK